MSYRKIEVNGKQYEYVIGKAVIKIKGLGIFPIEMYGNPVGTPYPNGDGTFRFVQNRKSAKDSDRSWHVTPRTVKGIILGLPPQPIQMMVDPFDAEIHDKINYLRYNPEVYENLLMDI